MSDSNTGLPAEAHAFAGRMYDAARDGQMDIFEAALRAGLPANMTNDKGNSLIMLAAYYGHAPLVSLLLKYGANPNCRNDKGQTPLAGAVFKNEDAVIEALLAGGADPEFGIPSATESIVIFGQEEKWKKKFEEAIGRGSGSNVRPHANATPGVTPATPPAPTMPADGETMSPSSDVGSPSIKL